MPFISSFLKPDWPAHSGVHALCTTRWGGVSQPPFNDFNLANHVGDNPKAVAENRARLSQVADLPGIPYWLNQTHSTQVLIDPSPTSSQDADAIISTQPGVVCAVLTADCLPILLAHQSGQCVAAIHAGWKGLAAGIIENTLQALPLPTHEFMAWIGPAIGPKAFEVDKPVLEAFSDYFTAFTAGRPGHWWGDLFQIAHIKLKNHGISKIYGAQWCTYTDPNFFSYRREGITGRMATLIWSSDL